jgi:hypothetical protein
MGAQLEIRDLQVRIASAEAVRGGGSAYAAQRWKQAFGTGG